MLAPGSFCETRFRPCAWVLVTLAFRGEGEHYRVLASLSTPQPDFPGSTGFGATGWEKRLYPFPTRMQFEGGKGFESRVHGGAGAPGALSGNLEQVIVPLALSEQGPSSEKEVGARHGIQGRVHPMVVHIHPTLIDAPAGVSP